VDLLPGAITRLTGRWEAEYHAWRRRDLHYIDYAYVWVDGVHFRVTCLVSSDQSLLQKGADRTG
jgi:transposase-like protein